MLLAVNGTLMRGQATNFILVEAGATYMRDARTASCYRLWSIGDKHPAMLRDEQDGASISLELWEILPEKAIDVLSLEPPGLVFGKILLDDGKSVIGVLGEPYLIADGKDITRYRGWREYLASK
jgi:hypothetical protein